MTAIAEIPTQAAAEAFANYGRLGEFESLFQRIETEGFPLGVEGRLRALALLSRLTTLGVQADAATLGNYLVPVLAGSLQEQQAMRRVVVDWLGLEGPEKRGAGARGVAGGAAPTALNQLERADRAGGIIAAGLIGLAAIVFVGLVVFSLSSGRSASAVDALNTVATYSQPTISFDFGLHPFWRQMIEEVVSRLTFAAAVLLVGLSFAAWRREAKARLIRQTDETDFTRSFQLGADVPNWFRSTDARAAFDRLKRVRLFDTNQIDPAKSVARSTRAGGLPLVAYKQRRELPNYVLLVDRVSHDDLAGIFARAIEAALIDARIVYARYDYSGGLDRLNPIRGGADEDIVDAEYLPFSVIASRHSGERLILIGAGRGIFEVPGFRFDREGHRTFVRPGVPLPDTIHLREFGVRFLITPTPTSAWGQNEQRLRELGFDVFSADVAGVGSLADQLTHDLPEDRALPQVDSNEERFLAQLDRSAMRLTSVVPPPVTEIERLARNLKVWAGRSEVYTLLAAVAAFPKIDSAFTFVLADLVLQSEIDSAQYARLVRLPWLRDGYMPNWLRIALINGLEEPQRKVVQAAQIAMLNLADTPETAIEETNGASSARRRLNANFDVARMLPKSTFDALISRLQPRSVLSADERIFFSVLRDYKLDPELEVISPQAPEIVADLIDAPERTRRSRIRAVTIGLAVVAAVLQPWIWTGFAAVGNAALTLLRAMGKAADVLFPTVQPGPILSMLAVSSLALSSIALAQWFINVSRREPFAFKLVDLWTFKMVSFWDPRPTAFGSVACTFFGLAGLSGEFGTSHHGFETFVLLEVVASFVFAWVCFVKAEAWWNTERADDRLERQASCDPVTGAVGALLVVAVWAVPWFLYVLPITIYSKSVQQLLLGAFVGSLSWVAHGVLARRSLCGEVDSLSLHRFWMDASFATMFFFTLASLTALFQPSLVVAVGNLNPNVPLVTVISTTTVAVYTLYLKATLGLRCKPSVWRSLINGAFYSWAVAFVGLLIAFGLFKPPEELGSILPAATGGLVFGFVTAFQLPREGRGGDYSRTQRLKIVLMAAMLFPLASGMAAVVARMPNGILDAYAGVLFWLLLPIGLLVWPMFCLVSRRRGTLKPQPLWRAIAWSPWWATLIMWPTAMVWHFGVSPFAIWPFAPALPENDTAFSLWPLALPVAVIYWRLHGARALPAIALGTLPLALQLGSEATIMFTPGGFWSAIAVVFLARFSNDAAFRARILRREHLPWLEAIIIVALLSQTLDVLVADIAVFSDPKTSQGGSIEETTISLNFSIDPRAMLAAVAFVIGASRMPATPFGLAMVAAPLLHRDAAPSLFGAIDLSDAVCALLIVYGARAWRTYAAIGIESGGVSSTSAVTLVRRTQMRWSGVLLASATAVIVAIHLTEVSLTLAGIGIRFTFIPAAIATLALVYLTGLIASDLWRDCLWTSKRIRLKFRAAYLPLIIGASYFALALVIGSSETLLLGLVQTFYTLSDLTVEGFSVSVFAYFAFGIVTRIVATHQSSDRWISTISRLWRTNVTLSWRSHGNGAFTATKS